MMKVMLTLQLPLIHTVMQDAFENLRASLLIEHAFPDPYLTILFIRKHPVRAARSHLPRTVNIHRHLESKKVTSASKSSGVQDRIRMRRSKSEQRILRSSEASRAGHPQDKSERKGDGGIRPRRVKCLAARPVLCSSAVAYTVRNGL